MGKKQWLVSGLLAAALAGYIAYEKIVSPILYHNQNSQHIEKPIDGHGGHGNLEKITESKQESGLETKTHEPIVVNNNVDVNVNIEKDDGPKDYGRFELGPAYTMRLSTSPRGQWQILERLGYDLDSRTQNPGYGKDIEFMTTFEDTPRTQKMGYSPITIAVQVGSRFFQPERNIFEIPKDAKWQDGVGLIYFNSVGQTAYVRTDEGKIFRITLDQKERQVSVIHYTLKFQPVEFK